MLPLLSHFRGDHQLRGRVYTFVVVGLAVFLVGLVLWPHPFHGYRATIVLSARTASGEPMPTADNSGSPLAMSETELLKLVGGHQFVQSALAPNRNKAEHALGEVELERVRHGLQVKHLPRESDQARLAITCFQSDAGDASGIAELLAAELIRRWSHVDAKNVNLAEHRRHQWAVVEARHYEKRARQMLDNFVQEHLERSRRRVRAIVTNQPQFDSPTGPSADETQPPEDAQPNPQWGKLSRELQELYKTRSEMLGQLTPEHPQVQDVAVAIARLEQDLADTPKFLGESSDANDIDAALPTPAIGTYSVEQVRQLLSLFDGKLAKDYQALYADFDTAAQKRETAEKQMDEATSKLTAHAAPTFHWQIEPMTDVEPVGGRPSTTVIGILTMLAVCVGGTVTLLRAVAAPMVLRSLREVEQAIPVPIVGEFAVGEPVRLTDPSALKSRGPQIATNACEVILVLFITVLLIAALLGSSLLWDLTSDPLGTLTQLFHNLV